MASRQTISHDSLLGSIVEGRSPREKSSEVSVDRRLFGFLHLVEGRHHGASYVLQRFLRKPQTYSTCAQVQMNCATRALGDLCGVV